MFLSMGLDCIVKYKDPESNQNTHELPISIVKLFDGLNLIGMNNSSNSQFISFRGKAYNDIVYSISGASLYTDLEPKQLEQIYEDFNKFNKDAEERFYYDDLEKVYNSHGHLIEDWIECFTNQYIPKPSEIIQLEQFFKICAENNLMLYASY
jgi:hypothetical protein